MGRLASLLALLLSSAGALEARPARVQLEGRVVRILDGDTVDLLIGGRQLERIRLEGIDAPEKGQPFSTPARKRLAGFCFDRRVVVLVAKRDRYGRAVGRILAEGEDLNRRMLREGLAWHYLRYAAEQSPEDREADARAEREARSAHRGVWSELSPVPPWDWRKLGRPIHQGRP